MNQPRPRGSCVVLLLLACALTVLDLACEPKCGEPGQNCCLNGHGRGSCTTNRTACIKRTGPDVGLCCTLEPGPYQCYGDAGSPDDGNVDR